MKQDFYKIPDQRIDKILNTIKDIGTCLATRRTVYARIVASFVGQIISTYSVVGNIVYLMIKHLTIDNSKSLSWYSYIKLSESIEQLLFWKEFIRDVNVKHFRTDEPCQSSVYSDASYVGFGGYIVETSIVMWFEGLIRGYIST